MSNEYIRKVNLIDMPYIVSWYTYACYLDVVNMSKTDFVILVNPKSGGNVGKELLHR